MATKTFSLANDRMFSSEGTINLTQGSNSDFNLKKLYNLYEWGFTINHPMINSLKDIEMVVDGGIMRKSWLAFKESKDFPVFQFYTDTYRKKMTPEYDCIRSVEVAKNEVKTDDPVMKYIIPEFKVMCDASIYGGVINDKFEFVPYIKCKFELKSGAKYRREYSDIAGDFYYRKSFAFSDGYVDVFYDILDNKFYTTTEYKRVRSEYKLPKLYKITKEYITIK